MLSYTEGCLGKCCHAECMTLSVLCSVHYAMLCCYAECFCAECCVKSVLC